jgi:hypothetical protein
MFGWHKHYLPDQLFQLSWSFFLDMNRINGKERGERLNAEKDDLGRSINAVKGSEALHKIIHAEKDERGKSLRGVKAGELLHSEKDEQGRSLVAMRTNKQVWESTIDGFRSHSGGVALHNKSKGWDPGARVRIN